MKNTTLLMVGIVVTVVILSAGLVTVPIQQASANAPLPTSGDFCDNHGTIAIGPSGTSFNVKQEQENECLDFGGTVMVRPE
jgi:hypothetical protein